MSLTATQAEKLVAAAPLDGVRKHAAGRGLYLIVGRGRAFWSVQYRVPGRVTPKWGCFGPYPEISTRDAARFADEDCKAALRSGIKPKEFKARLLGTAFSALNTAPQMASRPATALAGKTFAEGVPMWLAANSTKWAARGLKARATLTTLSLAPMDVAAITQADVLAALDKETARQHQDKREWLASFFSFAKAQQWRTGDNPARFDADTRAGFAKVNRGDDQKRHAAIAWKSVPGLMAKLGQSSAERAVAFTILTAVRAGSTEAATWDQIRGNVWHVPTTKEGEPLDVPLSPAALKLLGKRAKGSVFGLKANQMRNALQAHRPDATVHGMRSTFKEWSRLQTEFSDEVSEIALGHAVGSTVRRAYARDGLFERRRALMEKWTLFATTR